MNINPELYRKENETELQHHKRIIYGKLVDKTLIDEDYTDLSEVAYGQRLSSDVARREFYGSRQTLEIVDRNIENNISDDDYFKELETQKRELAKERIKLQTEKLEYSRWIREEARDELFEEKVIESIKQYSSISNSPKDIPIIHNKRCGLLNIADCHFGKEFKIYGLFDEVINEYSPEIFYSRMGQIYNETVEQIEKEHLNVLHIFNLGDHVEGFIRNSQLWSLRWGVIDSATIFGNYMGDWLKKLSSKINIVYHQTDGNHDELRLLDGKKGQHLCESAGKIVKNSIVLKNENNPNFTYVENKTGLIFTNIAGFNIMGIHGEVSNLPQAIKDYSDIYDVKISYLIAGHKHHSEFKNCGVKKGCIGVGSLVGSDDFSMTIRRSADATASFVIFEEGKGKTDEHTIVLN